MGVRYLGVKKNKVMQEIKQAGQNRLGEERLLRGGRKWFRCTKWLWESSLPQTAYLTQEIKLADVPLRFWALNSTAARCRRTFNNLTF